MKKVINFFVVTLMFYYAWLGIHTILFDFSPPFWVVLCVMFLSSVAASKVIEAQEEVVRLEKKREKDDNEDDK